jgi:hypothetical protein
MIVCADVETLDWAFKIGLFCPTSPVDTYNLDWAFQIGPFVAYECAVEQPRVWVAT